MVGCALYRAMNMHVAKSDHLPQTRSICFKLCFLYSKSSNLACDIVTNTMGTTTNIYT